MRSSLIQRSTKTWTTPQGTEWYQSHDCVWLNQTKDRKSEYWTELSIPTQVWLMNRIFELYGHSAAQISNTAYIDAPPSLFLCCEVTRCSWKYCPKLFTCGFLAVVMNEFAMAESPYLLIYVVNQSLLIGLWSIAKVSFWLEFISSAYPNSTRSRIWVCLLSYTWSESSGTTDNLPNQKVSSPFV